MTGINVRHGLHDLAADLAAIPPRAVKDMTAVVREGIRVGNTVAKDNARRSSGRHGKHYPKAFTSEMHGLQSALSGGRLISGEYGPDASRPQGGMSFEFGSRNQKPHLDLARSADLLGPATERELDEKVGDWFRDAGFR
jgi:hypothetical protein